MVIYRTVIGIGATWFDTDKNLHLPKECNYLLRMTLTVGAD
jgi:hypothetical protein